MSEPELNATILQRIDYSEELFILRVAPLTEKIPHFKAGQFAILGLPPSFPRCRTLKPERKKTQLNKLVQRAYSIASSPLIKDYLEFYITLVNEGNLSPRLACLKRGDKVYLKPKITGQFTLEVPEGSNVVLIATGTGIAPYLSMLYTYLKYGGQRFALIHGVRESIDLAYRSELTMMERLCPNFTYLPVISRPEFEKVPWKGHAGRVQNVWNSRILEKKWNTSLNSLNTHVYLCGNPLMIEEMVKLLANQGYKEHKKTEPGQVHLERYW